MRKQRGTDTPTVALVAMLIGGSSMGEIIQHFGKKGMRWGVTRSKKQLGSDTPKKSLISDEDLKRKVKRLKLEQEYHKLSTAKTARNQSQSSRAAAFVGKSVTTAVVSSASTHMNKIINDQIGKMVVNATTRATS